LLIAESPADNGRVTYIITITEREKCRYIVSIKRRLYKILLSKAIKAEPNKKYLKNKEKSFWKLLPILPLYGSISV
jgi:hypothetical protein